MENHILIITFKIPFKSKELTLRFRKTRHIFATFLQGESNGKPLRFFLHPVAQTQEQGDQMILLKIAQNVGKPTHSLPKL
jgi:hypothetical protein